MKILKLFLILLYTGVYIHYILSQDVPYFSSYPSGSISNYDQSSIQIVLRASSPLFITSGSKLVSIADPIINFNQWFELNNPITLSTDIGDVIFPKVLSFTNYDLTLSLSTPINYKEFTLFVLDNIFYNQYSISIPYSSPLVITRTNTKYNNPDITQNPLHLNKYSQQLVRDWDQDLNIVINDLSVRYSQDETPFLDVTLSIPNSGKGVASLNPVIKIGGNEYFIEDTTFSITKKNQLFKVPMELVNSLDVVQEDTSKKPIVTSPFEKSSRLGFYTDVQRIQSGELVCIEEPSLFQQLTLSGISQLETKDSLKYQFRYIDSPSVIFVEYTWDKSNGWLKALYLNKGYQCNKLDIRNQFCPYCSEVFHIMTKTNYTYLIYRLDSTGNLLDFGLEFSVNMFNTSFYFKNKKENVLQNSQASLSFSVQDYFKLDYFYALIPDNNVKDSSLYLWLPTITSGCNGINISYTDFYYESTCQMPQYSCSNIHYFREPQNETIYMNSKYNLNYDNKRLGIMYNLDSLTFEIPQSRMDFNLSLFIPNLPFMQPFIKEKSFKSNVDQYYINIKYSFMNYGKKDGDFNINLSCNGSSIITVDSGVIKSNETLEYSLSFPKGVIIKKNKSYECVAKVSINALQYWSKTDKELTSITHFSYNDGSTECNQDIPKDSIKISKEFKGQISTSQNQLSFLFKIENYIQDIDWFTFNLTCSKDMQSKLIQVSTGGFLNIPIIINSNSSSNCKISIDSFQSDCHYNIINENWSYLSEMVNSSNRVSFVSKSIVFVLLLVLYIL